MGDTLIPEFFPKLLLTKNRAGEWKEYKIIKLRLTASQDGRWIFAHTGPRPDQGIDIPVTPEINDSYGYLLWSIEEGPLSYDFNCTYELGEETIIPTGVVYAGELHTFS